MVTLLHIMRMQQSVTEGAFQFNNSFLHGRMGGGRQLVNFRAPSVTDFFMRAAVAGCYARMAPGCSFLYLLIYFSAKHF